MSDYGNPCSQKEPCTYPNIQCGYPACTWGRAEETRKMISRHEVKRQGFYEYRDYAVGDRVGIWMDNHGGKRTVGTVVMQITIPTKKAFPHYVIEFENHLDSHFEVRSGHILEMIPAHLIAPEELEPEDVVSLHLSNSLDPP